MGRKRNPNKKVTVGLTIRPDLLEELNKYNINKSELFEKLAIKYLDDLKKRNKK